MRTRTRACVGSTIILMAALLLGSCSELKKDVPLTAGPEQRIHEVGWSDTASPSFHGKILKVRQYDAKSCVPCHAKSFTGGTSQVACFRCHSSYPHATAWSDSASTMFHGTYLVLGMGTLGSCATCHGATFNGGTSSVSCYNCHESYPHASGWMGPASQNWHGMYLKGKDWEVEDECASCHGAIFDGGRSTVSCYTCHPSYPHDPKFIPPDRHRGYVRNNGYPLAQCQACHGTQYTGGSPVDKTCSRSRCHVDRSGTLKSPEACNTCHGDFGAPAGLLTSWAPPRVIGDTSMTNPAAGAHQKHLAVGVIGRTVKCQECHTVPGQVFTSGHIDAPFQVQVVFNDTLARLVTGGGAVTPNPSYSGSTDRCSGSFCHGNWRLQKSSSQLQWAFTATSMAGANASPMWTGGSSEETCTSCHWSLYNTGTGTIIIPVPEGHISADSSDCYVCHTGVDNAGTIIDQSKHINGRINMVTGFGGEYNFR